MHGDQLREPLEQITNQDDLLKAITDLYHLGMESNKREMEKCKINTAYARGNTNYNPRPSPIPNRRAKPSKKLHKEIIKPKIDTCLLYTSPSPRD